MPFNTAAVASSRLPLLLGRFIHFWNAITACDVLQPKLPSAPTFQKPRSSRRCWARMTVWPLEPDTMAATGVVG